MSPRLAIRSLASDVLAHRFGSGAGSSVAADSEVPAEKAEAMEEPLRQHGVSVPTVTVAQRADCGDAHGRSLLGPGAGIVTVEPWEASGWKCAAVPR